MKHVACISCGRMFEMPDNYYGTILCEACDPCMNDVDLSGVTNQALIRADSAEETIKQLPADNERLKEKIAVLGQAMTTGEKDGAEYLVEAYEEIRRLIERIENAEACLEDMTAQYFGEKKQNEQLKIANSQAHKDIFERQNEMAKLVLDNKVLRALLSKTEGAIFRFNGLREDVDMAKYMIGLKGLLTVAQEITEALEETDGD